MEQVSAEEKELALEKESVYKQVLEYSFETTVIHSDQHVLYINQAGADFFKADKEDIIGANVLEVFTDEHKNFMMERIRRAAEEREVGELIETRIKRFDGTMVDVELYCNPVTFGETEAVQSIIRDITSRKQAEDRLDEALTEIGAPIVPLLDGIAVLPLVGAMDRGRTEQILDIIPQKVQGQEYDHLIIDVSGIYTIDEVVVDFLHRLNATLKLLGISLIYTGLRPTLAQKAGQSFSGISALRTMSTVKQALRSLIK